MSKEHTPVLSGAIPVLYPPRVIPCGIHGMGGGLQKFQVDSMEWGMDSMEWGDGFHGMGDGFHTFGGWIPWNGGWIPWFFTWIPYFSMWIPYLFHMESSWNKFLESSIHTHALKFTLEWGLID